MKIGWMVGTLALLTAAPSFAQTDRGYVTGVGGVAKTPDSTSGDMMAEVGVRVAPHVLIFGDVGKFRNLQPSDAQPAVDSATASLLSNQGAVVVGSARVPARYATFGARIDMATKGRIVPYVLGGIGAAKLTPAATFLYTSGTLPDGSTPVANSDVTAQLVTAGAFTTPSTETARMLTFGGGVEIPLARHWAVDAGYRASRIAATTPLTAQGLTVGFGYRF